jgi:hypothetical protein
MRHLTTPATAVLTDPDYGFPAIVDGALPANIGLIAPLEVTNYTSHPSKRATTLIPGWDVAKLKATGCSGAKLLLYFHPGAANADSQTAIVDAIVEQCQQYNVPFFLEPVGYSLDPTQPLSNAERRQVVVESEVDESCLQELYRLTRSRISSEISLQFIASGKGGQGNSQAVKYLVRTLRDRGNDSIWGLVDRDDHSDSPEGIEFIRDRYSLENVILDPLVAGCHLLREKIVASETMGLPTELPYFGIKTQDEAQKIVTYVSSKVNSGEDMDSNECYYFGGLRVLVPQFYLDLRGHDLEDRLKEAFPPLKAYRDKLKQNILQKTIADSPQFIPQSAVEAFSALARN